MPHIQPFDFSRLPKVSRQEAHLLQALQSFFPRFGFSSDLTRSLSFLLKKELGLVFSLKMETIEEVSFEEVFQSLPKQGVYLFIGLVPLSEKILVEMDPFLAHVVIDKLLGGPGEVPPMAQSLTEIEEGVLSYLALKILSHLFEKCGESARVHFRLEGVGSSPKDFSKYSRSDSKNEKRVRISLRLTFNERAGYVRFLLPSTFLQKCFFDPLEMGTMGVSVERKYYRERLKAMGFLTTSLWTELGRVTLKTGELRNLEPGDVVIFEDTQVRIENGRLEGYCSLRVGRGESAVWRGRIQSDEKSLKLHLEEIV